QGAVVAADPDATPVEIRILTELPGAGIDANAGRAVIEADLAKIAHITVDDALFTAKIHVLEQHDAAAPLRQGGPGNSRKENAQGRHKHRRSHLRPLNPAPSTT